METLRTELIETQKTRSDLLKWKLLIVAGIGSAALGFSGSNGPAHSNTHLALAVIPIACFYVDLLCRHLSLRNKAIGKFLESHETGNDVLRDYEKFYDRISLKAWDRVSFESVALLARVYVVFVGRGRANWYPGFRPTTRLVCLILASFSVLRFKYCGHV